MLSDKDVCKRLLLSRTDGNPSHDLEDEANRDNLSCQIISLVSSAPPFYPSIQVVRTAYDSKVEGQSVVPSRGFGDFYYKQKRGRDGHLLPPEKQVAKHSLFLVFVKISSSL